MHGLGNGGLPWKLPAWGRPSPRRSCKRSDAVDGGGGGGKGAAPFPFKQAATAASLVLAGDTIAQVSGRVKALRAASDESDSPSSKVVPETLILLSVFLILPTKFVFLPPIVGRCFRCLVGSRLAPSAPHGLLRVLTLRPWLLRLVPALGSIFSRADFRELVGEGAVAFRNKSLPTVSPHRTLANKILCFSWHEFAFSWSQVVLNQVVLGPCVIAVVFAWNNLWQGQLSQLPKKYQNDALPTLFYGELITCRLSGVVLLI